MTGWQMLLCHVLSNVSNSIIVLASFRFSGTIRCNATLSFLGLGTQPADADTGLKRHSGRWVERRRYCQVDCDHAGAVGHAAGACGQPARELNT